MAQGISVHVGLNEVNLVGIEVPKLQGCVNDAFRMQELVAAKFSTRRFLNEEATYDAVIGAIEQASQQLVDGDIFLFTFSGHGTRHGTDDPDEPDFKDESIVLYDKILLDNVFRRSLWPFFKKGVRIFAVSDCCHGEGVFTIPPGTLNANLVTHTSVSIGSAAAVVGTQPATNDNGSLQAPKIRELEFDTNEVHFQELKDFYDQERAKLPDESPTINADLLLLSACQVSQKARDGFPNGAFTKALLEVMQEGLPSDYLNLHRAIEDELELAGESQRPVLILFPGSDPAFIAQPPFSI